jgi:Resolvase, N terminal domain
MKYGYARVSTNDQSTALQLAALKWAGCKALFKDEGLSRATTKRPALPCSSLIAIVVGGYQFAHGEPSAKKTDDIPRILGQ